ncbi:sugar phosphate isomerase/epimerase family protein [Arthrobacter sp. KN11-1C]|uniref:sugar phosphate isomerase/epimerase family protein n=1 Tax=Arthrobacter sp. KN11-1C TaxID=3445774 RepID=UPI003FA1871E
MSYSIQLYTVRRELQKDLPGTLQRLADLGFSKVEPYDFVATADALRSSMATTGLTAPSGHAPVLSADQDKIFDAAQRLGIGTVIEPGVPADRWQSERDILDTAEALNAAALKAAGYGIRIGYHNHAWELQSKVAGRTALEYFAEQLALGVVLEVDAYWAAVGGQNPAELLIRLGDRVKFIHIKDGPISTGTFGQQPAGQGSIPVWDVINAAQSLELGVIEFDDYDGDIFDAVARSLSFLQNGPVKA